MAKVLRRLSSKKKVTVARKLLFEIDLIDETNFNRCSFFVKTCITWLRERDAKSNRHILKAEVNQKNLVDLIKSIERQAVLNHYDIPKEEDPNTVLHLLREFFVQMKEPLISYNVYSSFIAANSHTDHQKKSKYLRSALSLLPRNNFNILKLLCEYLSELVSAQEVSQTTLQDVAISFGSVLLRPKIETRLLMVTDAEHIAGVVSSLIGDYLLIFSNVEETKANATFQTKMQHIYSSNALATLQELSELKDSENIDNKTFRSTLESLGDQLHKGDTKTLQMLVTKDENDGGHQHITIKSRSKKGVCHASNTNTALRIQIAKLKSAPETKEPIIVREAPEEIPLNCSDTERLLADEMNLIMKQIYGDESEIKKEVAVTNVEEKEEMRKILTNIYLI